MAAVSCKVPDNRGPILSVRSLRRCQAQSLDIAASRIRARTAACCAPGSASGATAAFAVNAMQPTNSPRNLQTVPATAGQGALVGYIRYLRQVVRILSVLGRKQANFWM